MLIRKKIHNSYADSRGFSLIEAMIAMVIMATGLVAIAKFQAGLVGSSASSKARAEAIALAQQKIDEIRNYRQETTLISTLSDGAETTGTMPTNPADSADYTTYDDYTTAAPYAGVNADFTRGWMVTTDGVSKEITVRVAWTDPKENSGAFGEFVNLSTIVSWTDPQLAADVVDSTNFQPIVPSATGDAELGDEADLTLTDYTEGDDKTTNNDGTVTVLDAGKVKLTDTSGVVLLTLEEACNNGGTSLATCTDFVKISGRIYFKDGFSASNVGSTYILASDAAFCAKYNVDTAGTITGYHFFDYTCYLGGSWHGNIGFVKPSNTSPYKGCLGDPDNNVVNAPQFATRRVYRGLIYEKYNKTDDGDAIDQNDEGDDVTGEENDIAERDNELPAFISAGIHDALELPNLAYDVINDDYEYSNYLPGHNFLVVNGVSDAAGCKTALEAVPDLTITDTAPNPDVTKTVPAFEGTPGDWFCFNFTQSQSTGATYVDGSGVTQYFKDGDTDAGSTIPTTLTQDITVPYYDTGDYRLVDTGSRTQEDNTVVTNQPLFGIENHCRYNPVDPPSELDYVRGSIYAEPGDAVALASTGYVVNTSDDFAEGIAGNCTVTAAATNADRRIFDYACQVYHTYDSSVSPATGIGWDGNILAAPPNNFGCYKHNDTSSYIWTYTSGSPVTADVGTQTGSPDDLDFYCKYTGTGAQLVTVLSLNSTDSSPAQGTNVTFLVTVTNNGGDDATNLTSTFTLPSGLTLVSGTPSVGTFTSGSGVWDGYNLANGANATLTVIASVDTANLGSKLTVSTTAASSSETDPSTTGDDLTEDIIVTSTGTANLVTEKTLNSSDTTPNIGDTVKYSIKVSNLGGGNVSAVNLTDTYPTKWTYVTATVPAGTTWTPGVSSGTWVITTLNAEDSKTLIIEGTIDAGASGTETNTTTAASSVSLTDPSTINDDLTEAVSVTANNEADLVTVKELIANAVDSKPIDTTPEVNDIVAFKTTITNNGAATAALNNVTDNLRTTSGVAGLTIKTTGSYAPSASSGTFNTSTGVWDLSGVNLAQGASVTLTLYADVTGSVGDTIVNSTTVATSNKTDPGTTGDDLTADTLTIVSSVSSVTVQGSITYGSSSNTVTAVTINSVDGTTPGTAGTCSMTGTTQYSCDATEGTGGVYLTFTFADTICENDAKIQSGALTRTGSDEVVWIESPAATTTKNINANKTTGSPKTNCP